MAILKKNEKLQYLCHEFTDFHEIDTVMRLGTTDPVNHKPYRYI